MKLYLVRHGETDWNKARKLQGQVDIPLNEFGRKLARKTAQGLRDVHFDLCISSKLKRAYETAEIILDGRNVPVITDDRIMEMAFGEWEGRCCSQDGWNLPESFMKFYNDTEHYEPAPGGESFHDMKRRTGEFLMWLYGQKAYGDKTILIATHGAALAGLMCNIKGNPVSEYWGIGVHKNCGVTEVKVKDGISRIVSENRVYYDDEVAEWASGLKTK